MRALSLALLCAACSLKPELQNGSAPIATIPIEIRSGIPTVSVSVAGRPLYLMVDLGGHQGISLTAPELEQVTVRYLPTTSKSQNAKGEKLEARRFVAPNVVLGNLALGDIEGGESIFGTSVPPDRNGYIGEPVLGRYLLVLDYPSKQIRLYRSGDSVALQSECGINTFAVDFANGIATSTASTEFGELEFVWDTGTTHNFLRPAANATLEKLGRRIDEGPPVVTVSSVVLGGKDFGPQEFRLVPFAAPQVDGYLGAGLMSSHKVCLDIGKAMGAVL